MSLQYNQHALKVMRNDWMKTVYFEKCDTFRRCQDLFLMMPSVGHEVGIKKAYLLNTNTGCV